VAASLIKDSKSMLIDLYSSTPATPESCRPVYLPTESFAGQFIFYGSRTSSFDNKFERPRCRPIEVRHEMVLVSILAMKGGATGTEALVKLLMQLMTI
jgi:hypothetical protein